MCYVHAQCLDFFTKTLRRLFFLRAHLGERGLQVAELLLELLDGAWPSTTRKLLQLRLGVARRLVHVDQILDLGELQPEPLAAQRELEAGPVAQTVDAIAAGSRSARAGRSPRRSGWLAW